MDSTSRWLSKLRENNLFCKANFFISGMIFGHSLVEYAVVAFLILYLTDNWDSANLEKSVIIVSATEGLSSVLVIIFAHMADTYLGRFKVISLSTIPFAIGLLLLWILNPGHNVGIYLVAAMLIAIGIAGREAHLKAFLTDQLRNLNNHEEPGNNCDDCEDNKEKRVENRTNIWWFFMYTSGAVVGAVVYQTSSSWVPVFRVSTVVMGVGLLFFISGFPFYHHEKTSPSPLPTIFIVFKEAILKRGLSYNNPSDYYENVHTEKLPTGHDTLCSRWLDKAALIVRGEEGKGEHCTATQVIEVKRLLEMLPMSATYFIYCLVQATGSTFFIEQASNLDFRIGSGKLEVPIVTLYFIQRFSKNAISQLWDLLVSKWFENKELFGMKVRIGIGIGCSCLCCVIARLVEIQRLKKVTENGFLDDAEATINMSIFWLTPQFILLGVMEGLTEDGFVDFYSYQVAKSMRSYGPSFNEFVLGIGKFISIFFVLTFSYWFGDTINHSHLDKYYGILALLSIGNLFVVYGHVSTYVYMDAKRQDKSTKEQENSTEEIMEHCIEVHQLEDRHNYDFLTWLYIVE